MIRRLSSAVQAKIAAGEVIERPSSVVKELVENSLDANATNVTIDISAGGRHYVRVYDDGDGIIPEQLPLAIEPFATSKLTHSDDLLQIHSFGFRGEALASIAAVSKLEIQSVTDDGAVGRRLAVSAGKMESDNEFGGKKGTAVFVSDLFANFPARAQFLKSERTESLRIVDTIQNLAVGNPGVKMTLIIDKKERLRSSGSGDIRSVLKEVLGDRIIKDTVTISGSRFKGISGVVSRPGKTRKRRKYISFFVNGRWVSNRTLHAAVSEAYRGLLPSGRYPMVVLSLEIPTHELDVNVHPTKSEIRFKSDSEIFSGVTQAIKQTLMDVDSPISLSGFSAVDYSSSNLQGGRMADRPPSTDFGRSAGQIFDEKKNSQNALFDEPIFNALDLQPIGQLNRLYIVATGNDGLYVIDQHAAHERVRYEKLSNGALDEATQSVLTTLVIEFSGKTSAWLSDNVDLLNQMGFSVDYFGGTSWSLRTVPRLCAHLDPLKFFSELVEDLSSEFMRTEDPIERIRWAAACHGAVKSGDTLSIEEMVILLRDLKECDLGLTCPHGRPTMLKFGLDDLSRQFGRA